jgi:hypothetical protein
MTQQKVTIMYFKAFFCHTQGGNGRGEKERKKNLCQDKVLLCHLPE